MQNLFRKMKKRTTLPYIAGAVIILLSALETRSSPTSSIWSESIESRNFNTNYRDRRDAAVFETVGGTLTLDSSRTRRDEEASLSAEILSFEDLGRQRREVDATEAPEDCMKDSCKIDACPMDDKSVEKCCKCFKTCCAEEPETSSSNTADAMISTAEPEPESSAELEPEGSSSGMDNMKKNVSIAMDNAKAQVNSTADKVGGFFKNLGQNIKTGVEKGVEKVKAGAETVKEEVGKGMEKAKAGAEKGVEKVKSTASSVKETVRKGIHNAADYVKNHTEGSSENQESLKKGAISTSPKNMPDAANSTIENVGTTMMKKRSVRSVQPLKKGQRSKSEESGSGETRKNATSPEAGRGSSNESSTEDSNNSKNRTSTSIFSQGMRKSKRSPGMPMKSSKQGSQDGSKGSMKSEMSAESKENATTDEPQVSTSESPSKGMKRSRRDADTPGEATTEANASDGGTTTPTKEEATKESSTQKPEAISESSSKKKVKADAPIRAPGSVDPKEITSNSSSGSVKKSFVPSSGTLLLEQGQGGNNASGTGNLGGGVGPIKTPSVKGGICRPLKDGLQCLPLKRDAARCLADVECPGTMKCCFYACSPNTRVPDIGVCDYPS